MFVVAWADNKWLSTEEQINILWDIMKYIAPVEKNELQLQCDNVIMWYQVIAKLSDDHSMIFIMFKITETNKFLSNLRILILSYAVMPRLSKEHPRQNAIFVIPT